jgi:hypothetical protein
VCCQVLEDLKVSNYWDLLLYEFAMNLAEQRIAAYLRVYGDGPPEPPERPLKCRGPSVDPRWRKDGVRNDKPFADSYLYSRPYCMLINFDEELVRQLW